MPDSATSPSLRELSDRAPQGEWTLEEMQNHAGSRSNAFTSFGIETDGKTLLDTLNATSAFLAQEPDGDGGYDVWDEQGKAVIEYVLRLVQDHRAGHLLDATTVAEREARARAEGLKEAADLYAERARSAHSRFLEARSNMDERRAHRDWKDAEEVEATIRALIPEARHEG